MATTSKVDVLQQLREGITELTNSDRWLSYLDVQRRFYHYSWGNCLLITLQRPDATRIAGYRKWQELGRHVRKGERAITILAPVVCRQSAQDETPRESTDPSSDPKVVRAFRTASVFDVAQTDGEPLPEIATRLLGAVPVQAFLQMKTIAGELGYSVDVTDIPGARNGDCNFVDRLIRLRNDLEPAHLTKTLAHEIAHALLHDPDQRSADFSRETAELEAESVAYMVCNGLGIDSSAYSVGYIAHWAGGGETAGREIERCAGRINKTARTILDGLEQPMLISHPVPIPESRANVVEALADEMTGPMSVGHRGKDWPEPLHDANRRVVPNIHVTVPQACEALQVGQTQRSEMANNQRVNEMVDSRVELVGDGS